MPVCCWMVQKKSLWSKEKIGENLLLEARGQIIVRFTTEYISWQEKRAPWPRRDLNTQPSDLESDALPLRHEVLRGPQPPLLVNLIYEISYRYSVKTMQLDTKLCLVVSWIKTAFHSITYWFSASENASISNASYSISFLFLPNFLHIHQK